MSDIVSHAPRPSSRSSKRIDKAKALMHLASGDLRSGTSRKSVMGKLSGGISGFFSQGKSKSGASLRKAASLKSPAHERPQPAIYKGYESLGEAEDDGDGDDDDDDDDDEFEDPRLRVRQLLGASSGRVVKSVMAQPAAIKKHIKAHADLIAEKERQRLDDLKAARAERARELEQERQERQERWLRRQGHETRVEDDTERQLRLMEEEERRLALKTKKLQDFDAPWHTNTLAGISRVLGELEMDDGRMHPIYDADETTAESKVEEGDVAPAGDGGGGNDSVPHPEYMTSAEDILSGTNGTKAPLAPWNMSALPDQQVDDDAAADAYGSNKQKVEQNESWADMLERTKRSLNRERDKSRQKARQAVGLDTVAHGGDEAYFATEDEAPAAIRQDRAASSAEEHRRLPKTEREWSFVPRQKVRNDVLALAQRTAKKAVARGKKK